MGTLSARRLALAWTVLIAVTLVSWMVGAAHGPEQIRPDAAVGMAAIAITLIKVRVIVREFMDVKSAPALLKRITDGWLVVFGLALLTAYFA